MRKSCVLQKQQKQVKNAQWGVHNEVWSDQGCVLSPLLCSIVLDDAIRKCRSMDIDNWKLRQKKHYKEM